MLSVIEKRVRGGIYLTILKHMKTNNEYKRNLDKAKKILYIQHI